MYPPAPWTLHGQLWVSAFRARGTTWGVGFVRYEEPSSLTYSELAVARLVRRPLGAVSIAQIWVDSRASAVGGRELWAIPKELGDFDTESTGTGARTRTSWSAAVGGRPVATVQVSDLSPMAVRLPLRATVWQPGLNGGTARRTRVSGSARVAPGRASWTFRADGPLGWLAGAKPLLTVRLRDFRVAFG